ncbi:hypothetical protein ACFU8W_27070 [Streptomyces sp. NPDC057565]
MSAPLAAGRVCLGVHRATDVTAGLALGAAAGRRVGGVAVPPAAMPP